MAATTETLSIQLPAALLDQIRRLVETGDYASSNDVVQSALETWLEQQTAPPSTSTLRELWLEARESDAPGTPADTVLDRLERKYQALSEPQQPQGGKSRSRRSA